MIANSQLAKTFLNWQKQGYIIKALVWFWVAIFAFSVITSILGIPIRYEFYRGYIERAPDKNYSYIYPEFWVLFRMACDALIAIFYFLGAAWLIVRYSGRGMPLLSAYVLLCFGLIVSYYSEYFISRSVLSNVFLEYFYQFLKGLANFIAVWFLLLFPNGRFVYRWCYYFAITWTVIMFTFLFFPSAPLNFIYVETFHKYRPYSYLLILVSYSIPTFAQIYRHYKSTDYSLKKKTKWIIIAMAIVLFGAFMDFGIRALYSIPNFLPRNELGFGTPYWFHQYVMHLVRAIAYSVFPIAICIALSKNNLWRNDPLIRRTILYSSLTITIVAIYISIIGLLSWLLNERFGFVTSIVAAGSIALLFHPIQQTFRNRLNKFFYGQRDEPYEVMNELSKGMEDAIDTESTLINFCESTSNVLKLPYMGIWLDGAKENPVAQYGDVNSDLIAIPLKYDSEILGSLKIARRYEGEVFNQSEKVLLNTIAQHISVIAHNYLLAQELQSSREQIIKGREEERRRIRRDLHDGLGPTLASTALQLQTARKLLYTKPEAGATILENLEEKMSTTLAEVRTLVHDLYPPVIDQLGLEEAIKRELEKFSNSDLNFTFHVEGELDHLAAAIEVATYRIVMEAVHNVYKHAHASECLVSVYVTEYMLNINIQDDGIGFKFTPP